MNAYLKKYNEKKRILRHKSNSRQMHAPQIPKMDSMMVRHESHKLLKTAEMHNNFSAYGEQTTGSFENI